jgi:hypothetical protein
LRGLCQSVARWIFAQFLQDVAYLIIHPRYFTIPLRMCY